MESLQKILKSRKIAQAPDEIKMVKDYILRRYKSGCSVKISRGAIIVSVPNSALAGTLQMDRPNIIAACGLKDLKLVIRNGR